MTFYRTKIEWPLKWGRKGICLCLFSLLLISCSNRNTPAPVISVQGSVPLNQRVKSSTQATEYYVKTGETLYSIAWRSDLDVRTIAKLNKILSPYKIYPGQKLILSEKTPSQRLQVNQSNSSTIKQNKNTSIKTNKKIKKAVAQIKKQEYGETVSEEKVSEKPSWPMIEFSQKIRKWQWPAKGKMIATYSTAIQGNKGIDIAGTRGDKVKAAAGGKVVYAGNALRGYGKLVIIKHNDDYLSAYAHNDKILVDEQQLVKAGELIAKMGKTDAQRVMLHFEVRFRGKSVNPLKYLPKK